MGRLWSYINKTLMVRAAVFFICLCKAIRNCFFPIAVCRFYPSCSEYFKLALYKKGFVMGLLFGLRRVLKCHPFNSGGYDNII